MKLKVFLVVLVVLSAIVSGCVSKPQEDHSTTVPSVTTTTLAPAEDVGEDATDDEIPDVAEVSEEELIEEPDLEINDTVDLGSLL